MVYGVLPVYVAYPWVTQWCTAHSQSTVVYGIPYAMGPMAHTHGSPNGVRSIGSPMVVYTWPYTVAYPWITRWTCIRGTVCITRTVVYVAYLSVRHFSVAYPWVVYGVHNRSITVAYTQWCRVPVTGHPMARHPMVYGAHSRAPCNGVRRTALSQSTVVYVWVTQWCTHTHGSPNGVLYVAYHPMV